jgi:hypothetical protein
VSISLNDSSSIDAERFDEVARRAEELLGRRVTSVGPCSGGGNNFLAVVTAGEERLIVKTYFYDPHDQRDRLGAEFGMLSFLWARGVRCVPEPVVSDPTQHFAIYRFIEGDAPRTGDLTTADLGHLVDLLGRMWELRTEPEARNLPSASDACLSLNDYAARIEDRVRRLTAALDPEDALCREALQFLRGEFRECFDVQRSRLVRGKNPSTPLSPHDRTLSPSDHGFHNALRRPEGWVFLDFEYAGWDDPAKMIADTCHQPRIPLSGALQAFFLDNMLTRLGSPAWLEERLRYVVPMTGLNWCLILLNEFIPLALRRRRFACVGGELPDKRAGQLDLARAKLARIAATQDRLE